MILSGHQPVYLPGIQLFNKIALSDAFMFVGHCQYTPKSWQTRNYIRTGMLSVPVAHFFGQSINETRLVDGNWRRKHIKSIELAYKDSDYFDDYFPGLAEIIAYPWNQLGIMNETLVELMLDWLEITTPIYYSGEQSTGLGSLGITGHKTDMLISMCEAIGAIEYLSNEGARDYVDEVKMAMAGIEHRWQKFTPPDYGQEWRVNGGNLSIIDLLFARGPEAGKIVRDSGTVG